MIKWLVVIGVVGFVYFYFIKKKPTQVKTQKSDNTKKDNSKSQANEMIECVICGIYCEIDDMILSGSKYYCSQECLEKA